MNLQLNSYHKKDRGSIHRAPHERVSAATLILCIVVEGVRKRGSLVVVEIKKGRHDHRRRRCQRKKKKKNAL